jgi:hypothetical protein
VIEVEWLYAIQLDITIFEDIDQGRGSNDGNKERKKRRKGEGKKRRGKEEKKGGRRYGMPVQ